MVDGGRLISRLAARCEEQSGQSAWGASACGSRGRELGVVCFMCGDERIASWCIYSGGELVVDSLDR